MSEATGCGDGACGDNAAGSESRPLKIAVLLDDAGRTCSPERGGTLFVFERLEDEWASFRKREFSTGSYDTMDGLRVYLAEVCEWLGECKVLAAAPSHGFYHVVLETYGVALWPVEGSPDAFFGQLENFYLHQADQAQVAPEAKPVTQIRPVADKAGHFEVDLRAAMGDAGNHGSRQVLLPFFRDVAFLRLNITCDHVPKWFSQELPALGLRADSESGADSVRVHVYPIG